MKTRTSAQRERQGHRDRTSGRYDRVNPCFVCEKSAGVDYCSHGDTDYLIGDALLVLCNRCAKATGAMRAPEALRWARERRETLGLEPIMALDEEHERRATVRLLDALPKEAAFRAAKEGRTA